MKNTKTARGKAPVAPANKNMVNFMDYQWVTVEDNILTIGVTEEGLRDIDELLGADLPTENDTLETDEVCGELETDNTPLTLYSPVKGTILEVNAAAADNPSLIEDDPYGEGWLFKIEADDMDEVEAFMAKSEAQDSDDDDDDDLGLDDEDLDFDEDDEDGDEDDDDLDDDDLDEDLDEDEDLVDEDEDEPTGGRRRR